MILEIVIAILSLVAVAEAFVIVRLSKRLLDFDELIDLLLRDVEVNTDYFDKLLKTPLFENSEEVKIMHRNMSIISKRFDEFNLRMQEVTRREQKQEEKPNPPVVR